MRGLAEGVANGTHTPRGPRAPAAVAAHEIRRRRFASTLDRLDPHGPIALAVSGGGDSLALLLLAHAARPGGIVAATVNHGLRPEAADEAAMVGRICRERGVVHAVLRVEVSPGRIGLQAAARAARYAALGGWATAEGAHVLATAHHLDDQAETLAMRLLRGSGIAGLAGIRPLRPLEAAAGVMLARPLLDWRKRELAEIVRDAGLIPVDDPSNRDPRHDRTGVRALLAREPLLEPGRLAAAAAALGEAEDALSWTTARLAIERVRRDGSTTAIDVRDLPRELRRRLLATVMADARGDALARLLDRLDAGRPGTLAGRMVRPDGGVWSVSRAPARRSG